MSDTTGDSSTCWCAGPARELVWSQFDDVYIAYHRPSGKTHFLNTATADLLGHVLVAPRTARSAGEELAAREGAAAAPDFLSAVAESLLHLEHLGLIERCDA